MLIIIRKKKASRKKIKIKFLIVMMMIVDSDNLPLNFFGGFDKSPASGHTTHLSSTNLEND